jgi:hypothetical protein
LLVKMMAEQSLKKEDAPLDTAKIVEHSKVT